MSTELKPIFLKVPQWEHVSKSQLTNSLRNVFVHKTVIEKSISTSLPLYYSFVVNVPAITVTFILLCIHDLLHNAIMYKVIDKHCFPFFSSTVKSLKKKST